MALRVAFFGLPLAALLLDQDGHTLELVALPYAHAVGRRRATRVFGSDRVWIAPKAKDPRLLARVIDLRADLLVSWFWTTRLPVSLLCAPRLGAIGAHPSLLPRHRGPDPTFWTIAMGDTETGVTVHRLTEEYDAGAILAQEPLPVDPTWNAWQLARALDRPSLRLLRATVARLARGENIEGLPQDSSLATAAPFPDDATCAIRWTWGTDRVLRHIRALAPAPGAWTEVAGTVLTIQQAAIALDFPPILAPGDGAVVGERVIVGSGDGAVEVLAGEIDGARASTGEIAALFVRHHDAMLD
jgi:methionyl-tRNA formyltransferase